LIALLLWGAPLVLRAQFGTMEISTVLPTAAFHPQGTGFTYINEGFTYLQVTGTSAGTFLASTNLPAGAKLNQVCAFAKDNSNSGEVLVDFSVIELGEDAVSPTLTSLVQNTTGVADAPGYTLLCATPPADTIIRFFGNPDGSGPNRWLSYRISVAFPASPGLSFGGALLKWQRVQAPAPAVATFSDVPTNFLFFRAIENLAASGITGGCAPGQYCPNANITRGEAAAFFSKALGLNWPQ
jgi:hypothetical protein